MNYLVILVCLVVAIMLIGAVILNQNRKASFRNEVDKYKKTLNVLESINKKLVEIDESIARSPETRKIYNMYTSERNKFSDLLKEYELALDDLKNSNVIFKTSEFNEKLEALKEKYDQVFINITKLYNNVEAYSTISADNESVSFTIKTKLKEIQKQYDSHLKVYGVYNDDFNSIIASINNKLIEFNELQSRCEFNKARNLILEVCDQANKLLGYITEIATAFNILENKLPKIIDNIILISDEMKKLGYPLNIHNFDTIIADIQYNRGSIIDKLEHCSLKNVNSKNDLLKINNEIHDLKVQTKDILDVITNQYNQVNEIINIDNQIHDTINQINHIFELALEEVESIKQKYNVNSTIQMNNISDLYQQYENFLNQYEQLQSIIQQGSEDYDKALNSTSKAHKYLNLVLNKLSLYVKDLEGLRYNEQLAQDVLYTYKKIDLEIELYLRRNHHFFEMSPQLESQLLEARKTYTKLEEELNKEVITISSVESLREEVIKSYYDLLGDDEHLGLIKRDMLQKIGCQRLIYYLGRCVDKLKIEKELKRFNEIYKLREYNKCYQNISQLMREKHKNGEAICSKIVDENSINIPKFNEILKQEVI